MAAALRLRAQGWDVTVIERQGALGGRAQVYERDGFRHDAGPTIITAPFLFDEIFKLFGRNRSDYIQFLPLDPWYRFRFHDGSTFDYGGTADDTIEAIRTIEPDDVNGYRSLLDHSKAIYDVAFTKLATEPIESLWQLIVQTPALVRLRADRTVWQLISRHLKNDKLRQAFSIQPLLIGGNPFSTTSIYTLIHYLERKWGVFFAQGGTGALVSALQTLMTESGITTMLSTTVEKISIENGKANGVVLSDGSKLCADVIVSNADPCHLYNNMIGRSNLKLPTKAKLQSKLSMGLFIIYFGTTRQYPHIAHNTISLGGRYRDLLADVFDRKILAEDFSLYLHRPTATDPSFAPAGFDSFYALCPVPNNTSGIDWTVQGPKLQQRILRALEETLLPDLTKTIRAAFIKTPDDFESDYLSYFGNGFSVAPYFLQSAWFRFHNRSESIGNLYLVGAGTHPGAGLPGVLCSAKIAANAIAKEHSHTLRMASPN